MKQEKISKKEIEKRAFNYFQSGYHCAESILKTILDQYAQKSETEIVKAASSFCGGIGGTHKDICGALTGGIIAIGCLFGRLKPGEDIQEAKKLAAEFRKYFIKKFGSSNCGKILERLGEQENSIKCKELTGVAAGMLSELLEKKITGNF